MQQLEQQIETRTAELEAAQSNTHIR